MRNHPAVKRLSVPDPVTGGTYNPNPIPFEIVERDEEYVLEDEDEVVLEDEGGRGRGRTREEEDEVVREEEQQEESSEEEAELVHEASFVFVDPRSSIDRDHSPALPSIPEQGGQD